MYGQNACITLVSLHHIYEVNKWRKCQTFHYFIKKLKFFLRSIFIHKTLTTKVVNKGTDMFLYKINSFISDGKHVFIYKDSFSYN